MNLHFEIIGGGRPVVLTSGIGHTGAVWSNLSGKLKTRAKLLVWDYRGHGRSEKSDDIRDYSAASGIQDLVQMISNVGGTKSDPAILIGHSLGGYLSLHVALQRPELVKALVLISTRPGFRDSTARQKWNEYVLTMRLGTDTHPAARFLGIQIDDTVINNLHNIRIPALNIVGGGDFGFRDANAYLLNKLPNSKGVVIENARHSVHRTHASEVGAAIMRFLDENCLT